MPATTLPNKQPTVFIVCSGLGHINRGYESFTRELFEVLRHQAGFRWFLFKGGGRSEPAHHEFRLSNVARKSWLGQRFGERAYQLEQATFCLSLLAEVFRYRPAVIFYSDFLLGHYLFRLRKLLPARYWFRLIYSNGAPSDPPYVADLTQQLLPYFVRRTAELGYSTDRLTVVPYGFALPTTYQPANPTQLRAQLNLPANQTILLSVGALNRCHKRMDYLIESVWRLNRPDIYVLALGETDEESAGVLALANERLPGQFEHRRVDPEAVANYYRAADLFVLASVEEGFPRATIEALSAGLPVLVHDYPNTREVLGDHGYFADFTAPDGLPELLRDVLATPPDSAAPLRRYEYARDKFSWTNVTPAYVAMIREIIVPK